jgi:hypothetical protein
MIAIDGDHRHHTHKIASVNCENACERRGSSAQTASEIDLSYSLNADVLLQARETKCERGEPP